MHIYPKSKRIWSIVKKSLENVALFHAYSKKIAQTGQEGISRPGGVSHADVVWNRIGFEIRGEGRADSAWDVNTRFITAQWTRSAALKGLTKIIPGSRVENRARARAHTTLTVRDVIPNQCITPSAIESPRWPIVSRYTVGHLT